MSKETKIDLNIQIEEFEKLKKEAQKRFNENYPNDEQDFIYQFEDLTLDYSEEIIEDNVLKISGGLKTEEGEEIGYFNLEVPLDLNKLIDIFQSYIKKLNKVKTVMESVKDE